MTIEMITQWIIAILPSVIAVISAAVMVIKGLKELKETKVAVVDMKKIEEYTKTMKNEVTKLMDENYELKKQLRELINKIDKIRRDK